MWAWEGRPLNSGSRIKEKIPQERAVFSPQLRGNML